MAVKFGITSTEIHIALSLIAVKFWRYRTPDFDFVSMETNSIPTNNQWPVITYTRRTRQNLQYEIRLCERAWNCSVIRTCRAGPRVIVNVFECVLQLLSQLCFDGWPR